MKYLALAFVLALSACSYLEPQSAEDVKQVQVLGRTWTVAPIKDTPNAFVATRDNNNLNPFGKPVARRTPQAISAIELATGCKVVRNSVYQNISAQFYANVACK